MNTVEKLYITIYISNQYDKTIDNNILKQYHKRIPILGGEVMIKQIKYFQTVVRCSSFTEAAEECYISQSAISQQIQALENELGVKLINRQGRKFSLTPAGEHFYNKSLILTADFEKICNETKHIAVNEGKHLRVGYLKCYGGQEFQHAIAEFSTIYPDISIHIINGNHEELYDLLRNGGVDLVLNDQRRAFSDVYVNFELVTSTFYIEISSSNPISHFENINVDDLKDISCILIASQNQQDIERTYYRDTVGFSENFLFADNLEEARLMVLGGKGFMPIEGGEKPAQYGSILCRIPLCVNNHPIHRKYCAFWKPDNPNQYIDEFAKILKSKFN